MSIWLPVLALVLGVAKAPKQEVVREPPPPVEVRASVDHATATTGDLITYTVEVEHNPGLVVTLPEPGANIAGLRIIDSGKQPAKEIDGRVRDSSWFKLRADLVGSYVLPPLQVAYRDAAGKAQMLQTSEIFLEVKSVLPAAGEATDIHDVKPLQEVHYRPRWLLPLLGALAVVLLGAGLWWWRRHRKVAVALPATPPHELAFAALDNLRRTDFSDPEAVRRYYFAISEVIRAYVEGRFGLNATDLTTEEIFARLHDVAELAPGERLRLKEFLADTDQVKFAGHAPAEEDIKQTYERALGFVEATRPLPAPAAESPDTPAAAA